MALKVYEPLDLLNQFRNFQSLPSLFKDEESNIFTSGWVPAVDIKEEDKAYVIHADVPGVKPDDIDVSMEHGMLTIKGERKEDKEEEKQGYKRVERVRGSFYRRFSLPDNADAEKIDASSENGVLKLVIPKKTAEQAKKIKIKAKD